MKTIKMKLTDLKIPKSNIRIHTEKQIKEFERSIKMFGQIRPIVVDEANTILCGNGLYTTLQKMGIDSADVYKISGLSENQKKKLMISDNKIYGLGIDDLETFNQFLNDLSNDLDIPGFDEAILKSMVCEAEEVTEMLSSYGTIDDGEIKAIQESKERKEELMLTPITDQSKPIETKNNIIETTEIKKSVICPHCGGEIWL